jgi:hypothetical protein
MAPVQEAAMSTPHVSRVFVVLFVLLAAVPALAQQTGTISGTVKDTQGAVLPGVTVEARASVLPTPRSTVTDGAGEYDLPALPPGEYTVKFTLSGMQEVSRTARVQLAQVTTADVTLGVSNLEETITVMAEATLVDRDTATIASGLTNDDLAALPVAQDYRDLQRFIPAVQVSNDLVRGPSAGGSGQDNVYSFDGVNVTLPLFGTLATEPASHDVDQVTIVRGGARAIDFDRSGGFFMDSVSKSGTSEFHGRLSYQLMNTGMVGSQDADVQNRYEQDRDWLTASLGGPVLKDRLFFYASYYRPTNNRENRDNLYGELPEYESTRNELFGKLTVTPTPSLLFNASYRGSAREDTSDIFVANAAGSTGSGYEADLKIATLDGSWVISPRSYATFKLTHFANETLGRPDNVADVTPSTAPGTTLDVNSLDTLGRLQVPIPVAGNAAHNAFVQPLIDRYGYVQNGVRVGGGFTGYAFQFDQNDFFRDAGQVAYNLTLGTSVRHELHVGFQIYEDSEDLIRSSNGWGQITVPGGRLSFQGRPIFYTARVQRQTGGQVAPIHSEYRSRNVEINDAISWKDWTFNLGLIASHDTLYGQGLREDPSTLSGFVAAPGNKYEMYDVGWGKMIQPRVGVTWAYNGKDTVYASFARYFPAASSLPRAASWDRNLIGTFVDTHFDANGVIIGSETVGSSSGKLFVEDLDPRRSDEILVGTARQINPAWSVRAYGRYRKGSNFWEDTNNNARIAFNPPAGIPRELYIPDLAQQLAQIGSGSTYVIAALDGAYTKYYEATLESEWRGEKTFVRGSYTWSDYYGNFDQDNTTGLNNDMNTFIGSSNIADGAGRQLWDMKDGQLRGDRPHLLKLYGFREFSWRGTAGAFFVFQSGQPWEAQSFEPYRSLTTSTSDSNRNAEPAGSRRTDSHWQMDLNYTQNFRVGSRVSLQVAADLFNVFDTQTGYNVEAQVHNSLFGTPRNFFDPRRLQVAARLFF